MKKRVMIVDDSRTARQQVVAALGEAGYDVLEASDGVDALEQINQASDLAVIICDINMPRMNGLDLLASLKQNQKSAHVPVLMLTTDGRPGPIAQARAAGAKGWMVKPFKPDLLLAAVQKLAGD
jgi:two-component system, chemotaxis family, chemotaxis protein CheY